MSEAFALDLSGLDSAPAYWERRPLWTLVRRRDITDHPDAELLSVYRDHGVVPKSSRDDNFNKPSEDLSAYRYVRPGDLVLNKMKTWQGSLAVSEHEGIVSPAYFVCEMAPAVHPRFVHHLLRSRPYIHLYQAASKGIRPNQWDLPFDEFRALPMLLPPLKEQRRIADFLDAEIARIDKMRQFTSRQAGLLEERFKESMRLETTTGSGPTVSTGIAWMPEMNREWRLLKVNREFRTTGGTTPTSSDEKYFGGPYPWVNSGDINDGLITHAEKSVTKKALIDFSTLKMLPAGALAIALYGQGATKGRVGILDMEACLNQACCALIPAGAISVEFAYYWFRGHKDGVVAQAVGAGQPNLSQELIRQLRIPVPDLARQKQIVERLRVEEVRLRTHTSLLRARDDLLAERRQALITAAVTGQFDVSTASGRNVTDGVTA
ncbi:restriction endonuclease subunit S [Streptomyces yangpuensis]|uniref:restriction endonuclease subunit S n=1 Tax=Streptomyces yangpuensis TaxID=1648182 RepID=UPI003714D98B